MLDLFDQNGHLTDEALQALIREEDLDELQRLEISEHLSFCDACTARYTDLLCDDVLQSPPVPLYGEIMKKVQKKERRLFLLPSYYGFCCGLPCTGFLVDAGFSLFPAKGSTEVSGRNKLYRQVWKSKSLPVWKEFVPGCSISHPALGNGLKVS